MASLALQSSAAVSTGAPSHHDTSHILPNQSHPGVTTGPRPALGQSALLHSAKTWEKAGQRIFSHLFGGLLSEAGKATSISNLKHDVSSLLPLLRAV